MALVAGQRPDNSRWGVPAAVTAAAQVVVLTPPVSHLSAAIGAQPGAEGDLLAWRVF